MAIVQTIAGCFDDVIGPAGLSEAEFARWTAKLTPRFEALKREARERSLPHIAILYATDDLIEARAAYDRLVSDARVLIIR